LGSLLWSYSGAPTKAPAAEVRPASKLYLEQEQVAHPFPYGNTLGTS